MAKNPHAAADHETFTVRRTIEIAAPVDKVWSAVTEPEHISRWFGQTVLTGEGVGAHGTITWPGRQALPLRVEAVDAPHTVTYRWCNDDDDRAAATVDDAPSTVFTFTLEPTTGGTRLTVEESGFEFTAHPGANLESHRQGWDGELDKLVVLLEGGGSR